MPEDHYIEPLDHTTTAESMPDRSDLTTIYPDPAKPYLGRIVKEEERQQIKQAEQDRVMRRLRRPSLLIGLLTGLPVVGGMILLNFFATNVDVTDRSTLMPLILLAIILLGGYVGMTVSIVKWLHEIYSKHLLKAWPVTVTVVTSMLLVLKPILAQGSERISGIAGYGASIAALLALSTVLVGLLILVWTTPKMSGVVKMVLLLVTIGAAACVHLFV